MGFLADSHIPMGLTFASKAYDDNALLSYGYAFETAHQAKRLAPSLTPALPSDEIAQRCVQQYLVGTEPPVLTASARRRDGGFVEISGAVDLSTSGELESLEVFVDGVQVGPVSVTKCGGWSLTTRPLPYDDPVGDVPVRFVNDPDQSLAMFVVVASAKNGRSDAKLLFA